MPAVSFDGFEFPAFFFGRCKEIEKSNEVPYEQREGTASKVSGLAETVCRFAGQAHRPAAKES
jgi:hypothetical protein